MDGKCGVQKGVRRGKIVCKEARRLSKVLECRVRHESRMR